MAPTLTKPKTNQGGLGFEAIHDIPENWFWSVCGREYTLKSSLACTFPEPIYFMAFDPGYLRALKRFPQRDIRKKFYRLPDTKLMPNQRRILANGKPRMDATIDFEAYEDLYSTWYEDWLALVSEPQPGTIVVDTGKDIWDVFRGAKTGRLTGTMELDYTTLNLEFDGVLRKGTAPYGCMKHVVWIDRMDKQYVKEKGAEKGEWNGNYERVGYKHIGSLADVTLEMFQLEGVFGCRFGLKSGPNKGLIGVEYMNDKVKLEELTMERQAKAMDAGREDWESVEVKDVCTFEFLMEELYG